MIDDTDPNEYCSNCGGSKTREAGSTNRFCDGKCKEAKPGARLAGVVIAVDFDGTCVTHDYPAIGTPIGAERVLRRIIAEGGQLILWTMRSGDSLRAAVDWFDTREIPLFGIQNNPTQLRWTDSPKAHANHYIDDAALGCPLKESPYGGRPFVDWDKVEGLIFGE